MAAFLKTTTATGILSGETGVWTWRIMLDEEAMRRRLKEMEGIWRDIKWLADCVLLSFMEHLKYHNAIERFERIRHLILQIDSIIVRDPGTCTASEERWPITAASLPSLA